MPNIKSSKKDVIRSKVAYEKNKADKSAMKTAIKKFEAAIVDPIKTGNGIMVLCNVRLKHHSKEFSRQFTSVIAGIDEVVECFNTSGDYDYQLKIYARNMQDYQEFVLGTLGDLDCIGSLHSIFVIGEVKNTLNVPLKA